MRPKIVIEYGTLWSYYQWFLLGFYELKREGIIEFEVNIPLKEKITNFFPNNFISRCLKYLFRDELREENYNLGGVIRFPDGKVANFCIDCMDSPMIYCYEDLKRVDCYFKMQCPKDLEADDFALTDDVHCPWTDSSYGDDTHSWRKSIGDFHKYSHKIMPLMVGPRRLSYSSNYRCMKKAYNNSIININSQKSKFLMSYFGNSKGPIPKAVVNSPIDWNEEAQIMWKYGKYLNHPNEKRLRASKYISEYKEKVTDARVINNGNSDAGVSSVNSQFIPYDNFTEHVSHFCYNFNVSGYRMSIPNRFIESFMVGTAIFTDRLSVKWYKPFSADEVQETVKMGYLPIDEVDWDKFNSDIRNLQVPNKDKIVSDFYEKWSPVAVARYIISTVKEQIN